MFFLSGPRQVGKTTSSKAGSSIHRYMTWDDQSDRLLITKGPKATANHLDFFSPFIIYGENPQRLKAALPVFI